MKLQDYFASYLEYLRQKGLSEHTIQEHKRFIDGSISHAIIKDAAERKRDIKIKTD